MRRRNPNIQRQHEVQHNTTAIPPPQRRQFFSTMLAGLENTNEDENDGEETVTTEGGGSSATPKTRNVLGVVDEFLFGPSTAATKTLGGPQSVHEVWRLRACAVVGTASASRPKIVVHPAQLLPYVENPPNVPSTLWWQHQHQQQHSTETKNETNPVVVVPQSTSQIVDLSEALKI